MLEGYPELEELEKISLWLTDFEALMEYVHDRWWGESWAQFNYDRDAVGEAEVEGVGIVYTIATGGWSGNEDLVEALEKNFMFWTSCWTESKRGGLYIFEVKK